MSLRAQDGAEGPGARKSTLAYWTQYRPLHRSGHTKRAWASESGSLARKSWRVGRNMIPGVRPPSCCVQFGQPECRHSGQSQLATIIVRSKITNFPVALSKLLFCAPHTGEIRFFSVLFRTLGPSDPSFSEGSSISNVVIGSVLRLPRTGPHGIGRARARACADDRPLTASG
jgi:hypothetical protein